MSDELREALDRLPRLRITGEQLDAIDPDPEKVVYTDWDEWDEYVRLDAVRAALAALAPAAAPAAREDPRPAGPWTGDPADYTGDEGR